MWCNYQVKGSIFPNTLKKIWIILEGGGGGVLEGGGVIFKLSKKLENIKLLIYSKFNIIY